MSTGLYDVSFQYRIIFRVYLTCFSVNYFTAWYNVPEENNIKSQSWENYRDLKIIFIAEQIRDVQLQPRRVLCFDVALTRYLRLRWITLHLDWSTSKLRKKCRNYEYRDLILDFFFSMALQPFGPWPLFQFLNPIHSWQDSLDGGSARKERPARKADNLTAICVSIAYKMWKPQRLTTLWASTACYRDSFSFLI
jgi:hypothetical protein